MSCKNLTEALDYIRENFPEEHREILLSSSRLAGFIGDLLPGAKRERTVFKAIFGQGIHNKLAAAIEKPPVEQQMLMARYAGILADMGLAREAAEDVLWTYAEALGFEKRPVGTPTPDRPQASVVGTPTPDRPKESVKIGDIIPFGSYDWRVLDKKDGKALLISRDILEKRRFDGVSSNRDPSNIWADSELHKYLNGEFFSRFSADDKSRVYPSSEGNVFLLSIDEARKYFKNDTDRMAKYNGGASWWWLRSPGSYSFIAASVHDVGLVYADGLSVYNPGGIRPALWLNL